VITRSRKRWALAIGSAVAWIGAGTLVLHSELVSVNWVTLAAWAVLSYGFGKLTKPLTRATKEEIAERHARFGAEMKEPRKMARAREMEP
jgi:hypothetical protein